jgi:Putative MetA-pathway of phenol degradation
MARRTCWQRFRLALALVSLGTLAVGSPVGAGELGHYAPGLLNIRDTIMPGKGLYTAVYGVSQFLPLGPGLVELGILGYSQWQVTDDSGSAATKQSVHDQLHAVGVQVGYEVPKWRLGTAAKYLYQYYAEDRFKGHEFTLTVGYQFF